MANRTCYISGPMRGVEFFNFHTFLRAERELRKMGFEVFNPASKDIEGGFDPVALRLTGDEDLAELGFDLLEALKWDAIKVLEADCLILLPNWKKSRGAMAEYALAKAAGKTVYEYQSRMLFGLVGRETLYV